MINAGILDGDYVIAEKTPVAENGEIVVGMIGDEATVKRFYKEKGTFRLQPENPISSPSSPMKSPFSARLSRSFGIIKL